MTRVRTIRLKKLATDVNNSVDRLIEFLHDHGIEEDFNQNTKVLPEWYDLIMDEFSSDKDLKDKSAKIQVKKERKSIAIDTVTERKKETPAEKLPETESEKTPEESKKEKVGPTIVGKIDLKKAEPKKKPEPKKAEKAEKAEKESEESPKKEKPKTEKPKVKEPVATKKEIPATDEIQATETIKARAEVLKMPTVLRTIKLPEKPKKKEPVARSSDNKTSAKKTRRRRIPNKAVDVKKVSGKQHNRKQKRKPATRRPELTEEEIQKEIKETLARLSSSSKSKGAKLRRQKRQDREQQEEEKQKQIESEQKILKVTEFVTVSDLASLMEKSPTDIIGALMSLGIFASINQRLDAETMTIIADEFGYEVEFTTSDVSEMIEEEEDKEEDLISRSPIVTVMGHVDHGKTSLLDFIRSENVIGGEAGGITQHIGAYNVTLENGKKITFLDTPGHEAFTAMRARGAQVTDIAIIIIAADDNVMPQTKEAINHAQAAGVPMVFAFNKIDRPDANVERLKQELSGMNILVEDWGGKFQSQEISAKTGEGIDDLLEKVLLEAEMLELKANPDKRAVGTVIESLLDKGRGYVATVLVESGTMRVGDPMLAGQYFGKVKAMFNERDQAVSEAGPSIPVSILGLSGAPNAGDRFNIMADEREGKSMANKREKLIREQGIRTQKHITLDEIGRRIAIGEFNELNIIVKGDVDGSIEALSDSLLKLSTDKVQVNIIHKGVGQISESDVMLASASDAIIIGFQVRPSVEARRIAENEEIQIKLYSVIYSAIEDIKDAMEGMLSAKIEEEITGSAEVRDTFTISKVGTIAGCYVLEGKLKRNNKVRLIRDGIVIYQGALGSLKRFKDDVKEVKNGYECGLNIEKFNDIKVGDIVESFEEVEVKQKL
jgi:translation initiation factor IF-2